MCSCVLFLYKFFSTRRVFEKKIIFILFRVSVSLTEISTKMSDYMLFFVTATLNTRFKKFDFFREPIILSREKRISFDSVILKNKFLIYRDWYISVHSVSALKGKSNASLSERKKYLRYSTATSLWRARVRHVLVIHTNCSWGKVKSHRISVDA